MTDVERLKLWDAICAYRRAVREVGPSGDAIDRSLLRSRAAEVDRVCRRIGDDAEIEALELARRMRIDMERADAMGAPEDLPF